MTFRILTIQSHVVHGYVGNKVATFALQRLGNEVLAINTLQFSNHTGYDKWRGQVFSKHHIDDIIFGLKENNMLFQCDAIITGYVGSQDIGESVLKAVAEIRSYNKSVIFCCDPVMGDTEQGFYVTPDIQKYMRTKAVPLAYIITPNQFEAIALTNQEIKTLNDVKLVARKLFSFGPRIIVITSIFHTESELGTIENLVFDGNDFYICKTPYIEILANLSGSGDLFASLFLANYLNIRKAEQALQLTVSSIYSILDASKQKNNNELAMISSQDYLLNPKHLFEIKKH